MRKFALPIALVFGFAMIGCSDDDNCVDVDGDGYGTGTDCLGTDCDDNDGTVWMAMDGYQDLDGDGEYAQDPITVCTDGTLPSDYSDTAGTDCDDTNADAVMIVQAYLDDDDDGFGTGAELDVCADTDYLPPGYADNADDCDDASALIFTEWTGYPDMDGDGVPFDTAETVCGTSVMPVYLSDTAGTDCDDDDVMATNDASHGAMCTIKGLCIDSEPIMGLGMPDMGGIGACATVDCNGQDAACKDPMIDTGVTCVTDNDCNGGEICKDFAGGTNLTCWAIPNCCNNDNSPNGLTCNELALTCLLDCNDLADDAARLQCVQFTCFENATSVAQQLYNIAQTCAAEAGCFTQADFVGCAMAACNAEFVQGCLGDLPAP